MSLVRLSIICVCCLAAGWAAGTLWRSTGDSQSPVSSNGGASQGVANLLPSSSGGIRLATGSRDEFLDSLKQLRAEDMPAALAALEATRPRPFGYSRMINGAVGRWITLNPAGAAEWLVKRDSSWFDTTMAERTGLCEYAWLSLAEKSPAQALRMASLSIGKSVMLAPAVMNLVGSMAGKDLTGALAAADSLSRGSSDPGLRFALQRSALLAAVRTNGPSAALDAVAALNITPAGRNSLIGATLGEWIQTSPESASQWLAAQPRAEQMRIIRLAAPSLEVGDPARCVELQKNLPLTSESARSMSNAMACAFRRSPAEGRALLATIPEGPYRTSITMEMVRTVSISNPMEGFKIVDSVPSRSVQQQIVRSLPPEVLAAQPERCLEQAGMLADPQVRNSAQNKTLAAWAESAPEKAAAWAFANLSEPDQRDQALSAIVGKSKKLQDILHQPAPAGFTAAQWGELRNIHGR